MSEILSRDNPLPSVKVFTDPPPSSEQLLPPSPVLQLYEQYTGRISDFPGFRQRQFNEARHDFMTTIHEPNDVGIDVLQKYVHSLITEESHVNYLEYLRDYWVEHSIESDLEYYSYVDLGNHFAFSDIPIKAASVRIMRRDDPHAAQRNIQIVGRMIPGMEVDLFGTGDYAPVTPLLAISGRQVQTVPAIPNDAPKEVRYLRSIWNHEAKHILEEVASTPGNYEYEAGSGTHDEKRKGKLIMNTMNEETARLLCNPRLKVMGSFFMCDSFGGGKLKAAEAKFGLIAPRVLKRPEEAYELMEEIAELGTHIAATEFPDGVHYEHSIKSRVHNAARSAGRMLGSRFSTENSAEY